MAAPAKRLKVGLVLDSGLDAPDGVQQYVLAIGGWLRSKGHDVHYLVGRTGRRDIANIHSLGRAIKVSFNGNKGSIPLWASRKEISELLASQKFDILHVQIPHHPLLAQPIVLAADKRMAVIGTFHIAPLNSLVTIGNKLLGLWLKPSLRRFDRIVSVSSAAADFAKQTFGIKTDVLPNVVDIKRFASAKPLRQYSDGTLTILFLGRLVSRKGCGLLLEAVSLLAKQNDLPEFRVLICGRGPLEAELKRYANDYGLEEVVEFIGFVSEEDKPRYYASADIAVFPSRGGESFGIVLLEAMAAGHAVVLAGDNPGYASVMAPQPELLFNAQKADALAAKLAYYMRNQDQREAMRDWGLDYAREFDIETVGSKLLDIYNQALRKRRDV